MIMKNIFKYIAGTLLASFVIVSCHEDKGNYDYLSEDELKGLIIRIDTTGIEDRYAFSSKYNPGDIIKLSPKVHYAYPEDLKYSWIVYDYPYSSIPVGNTSIYPKPDTISHDLNLEWAVNLKAGWHKCHLIVQDTVRGLSASMDMGGYFTVNAPGARPGVMVLSEYNGQTDLDFYSSLLCLIYEDDVMVPHYYSQELGHGMLDGEPLFISFQGDSWAGGYYYVFTTKNAYRLNFDGLELMETFDQMFYQVPEKYDPQAYISLNNSEFLINDGKLHIINNNKENDRKFSAPISGDYQAGKYLSIATISDWRPTAGAISADQVVFDEKNLKFRPYFANDIKLSEFGPTVAGAFVDANKVPAKPLVMGGGVGGSTYAIVVNPEDGKPYLYMYNFYDVVDDGDLSADGANSVIDLSGCKDIMNMKYFQANYNGSAFFYATDKALYSFSPTSGQTTANELYTCASGEEITCLSIFFHHASGGFPTPGVALWLGIWEEGKQEGKLLEWEIDPDAGVPVEMWGPMFGAERDEVPFVTTGFGKIKSIASVD